MNTPYCKILALICSLLLICCNQSSGTFFKKISMEESGVDFNNQLTLDEQLTVLEFEYMYNGAGVGVADFDLDGNQDIYFTGNMVSNRLYRNLGGFKFEDITETAKVGSKNWSNGVSIVDLNQDGLPDIYVSKGGPRGSTAKERSNLLFINQGTKKGHLTFVEEAAKWGLADSSYSVQAAFFDYDRDGDLDMYLLSNALVDFNRNTSRPKDRSGKAPSADKLFRNNGDQTFTEVSKEANILIEGFGLGIQICDMNTDGWPDIYVSNDFLTDDLLYINQKDGSFKNENASYFQHLTFNGMGNDIADINNDGLMDVVVLDMLPEDNKRWKLTMMGNNYDEHQTGLSYGYQPQYIRNTLQINNGNGTFSEVGQLAGIAATEWSWSALFADFDHDGLKDLSVTNGYRQDITNLDFMVYGNQVLSMGTEEANRKQRLEHLNKLPGIKLGNYFFKNTGDLSFENLSEEAGFDAPSYSNGMAYADFDNDGDLDLVVNNIDDPAFLFENIAPTTSENHYVKFLFKGAKPNISGLGSEVSVYYNQESQRQYFTPYRGYLSTVEPMLHFGLGTNKVLDSVRVVWPDGKIELLTQVMADQEVILYHKNAFDKKQESPSDRPTIFQEIDSSLIPFNHKEDEFVDFKIQPLLPHMHSRNGPGIAIADTNADGREDIYIGGATNQSGIVIQQLENGRFETIELGDAANEDMGLIFFDADNDGDQDIYISSGGSSFQLESEGYKDRIYQNDGDGNFSKVSAAYLLNESSSVVTATDYDKDGLLDLFVGGRIRPGEYPLPPTSMLLKNRSISGKIQFEKQPLATGKAKEGLGMVTAALWTDFNNDTWSDLIIVGEFMSIRFFENKEGKLVEVTDQTGLINTHGWWNSISAGDFDNDGDTDYILGNLGLNSRFRASAKEPLCIYANDYDKNGQIDPVMCHYVDGENYVAHSRNDLIEQISAMRGRFRTYTDYAEATFEESFLKEELADAYVVKSETFANSYLENLGDGKFSLSMLPRFAQTAPLYGSLIGDYNDDGNLDILAVGNFYSGEVFGGRYDASTGWFLSGDGQGHFASVPLQESGFFVQGDTKALVSLKKDNEELLLATINNGPIKTHSIIRKTKLYRARPNDIAAYISFENGSIQKQEFNYGSGYLSQSSRGLYIPDNATSVTIIDANGKKTEILP